jgi:hypothetical protein
MKSKYTPRTDNELFETNDFSNMKIIPIYDGDKVSNLYWMDDFYKHPDDVFEYINSFKPPLWKTGPEWDPEKRSKNTLYFEDRRHMMSHPGMVNVTTKLHELCGQEPTDSEEFDWDEIVTNYTRFNDNQEENPYKTHYWWPHHDSGYNGICYLLKNNEIGTNLYKPLITDRPDILPLDENGGERDEHGIPWTPKKHWDVFAQFRAKFNRFVMFEGSYYYHSMHLNGENYFAEHWSDANYRINQVFFFVNPENDN